MINNSIGIDEGDKMTPDPMIAKELTRTTSDFQIRSALKKLGTNFKPHILQRRIVRWHFKTPIKLNCTKCRLLCLSTQ